MKPVVIALLLLCAARVAWSAPGFVVGQPFYADDVARNPMHYLTKLTDIVIDNPTAENLKQAQLRIIAIHSKIPVNSPQYLDISLGLRAISEICDDIAGARQNIIMRPPVALRLENMFRLRSIERADKALAAAGILIKESFGLRTILVIQAPPRPVGSGVLTYPQESTQVQSWKRMQERFGVFSDPIALAEAQAQKELLESSATPTPLSVPPTAPLSEADKKYCATINNYISALNNILDNGTSNYVEARGQYNYLTKLNNAFLAVLCPPRFEESHRYLAPAMAAETSVYSYLDQAFRTHSANQLNAASAAKKDAQGKFEKGLSLLNEILPADKAVVINWHDNE